MKSKVLGNYTIVQVTQSVMNAYLFQGLFMTCVLRRCVTREYVDLLSGETQRPSILPSIENTLEENHLNLSD